ncbi:hypothetical protein B0H14DRAFT_2340135, partial [Mycena olivaceomarginata]
ESRLPDGMRRLNYDADTGQYMFCDRDGRLYIGQPHEKYGAITLIEDSLIDRPHVFAPGWCYR